MIRAAGAVFALVVVFAAAPAVAGELAWLGWALLSALLFALALAAFLPPRPVFRWPKPEVTMPLIPPNWLQEVHRYHQANPHSPGRDQIQVVLESYRLAPDYACPFVEPTLECGDCGTRVMLQESRTRPLRAEWWEIVACMHEKGHVRCHPVYQAHSARRCRVAQAAAGRSALPWIFDGTP